MPDFLAHYHPLLVHLPLGFLLAGAVLAWRGKAENVLPLVWFLAAAAATLACLTGWFSGDYWSGEPLVELHRWLGLTTAALASATWFFRKKILPSVALRRAYAGATLAFSLAALVAGTRLTHGSDFFFPKNAAVAQGENLTVAASDVPSEEVPPGNPTVIQLLEKQGVVLLPVAAGSNFLSVNFINVPTAGDSTVRQLEALAPQIVWLRLSGAAISDSALVSVGKLLNLSRLHLDGAKISDAGLAHLAGLKRLRLLNLNGTAVSSSGLAALRGLPFLEKIFLFKTGVGGTDLTALRANFPKTELDTGGYVVPSWSSDTAKLHAPKKK